MKLSYSPDHLGSVVWYHSEPKISNWSETIFCRFLKQTGSSTQRWLPQNDSCFYSMTQRSRALINEINQVSKGWFDEFETNVRGPRAPQVEFSNTWHKICQKIEISTIHLMYSTFLYHKFYSSYRQKRQKTIFSFFYNFVKKEFVKMLSVSFNFNCLQNGTNKTVSINSKYLYVTYF